MDFGKAVILLGVGFAAGVWYSSKVYEKNRDEVYSSLKEDLSKGFETASDKLSEGLQCAQAKVSEVVDNIKSNTEQPEIIITEEV